MRFFHRACTSATAAALIFTLSATSASADPAVVERWAGENRYNTSAVISQHAFSPGVSVAFVASGKDFPDALSGAPVAGASGKPVLLTDPSGLSDAVRAELTRLVPAKIVVLGGSAAVSDAVVTGLGTLTSGGVTRWAGANRYATSAEISEQFFSPDIDVAFIASGRDFPDALSGAPIAGCSAAPVLLTDPNGLSAEVNAELARLTPDKIVILGGPVAVSEGVAADLTTKTDGDVVRWAGANRYATSAVISSQYFPADISTVYVASGTAFPDALAGAAAAGSASNGCGPVLLTGPTGITEDVRTELIRLDPAKVVLLGGPAAVNDPTGRQVANPAVRPRPSSPDLDCPDFDTVEEAQATLDHGILLGLGDVHGLDADDDGIACESGV